MEFIILSPKESSGSQPCFWRANNCGYTNYPFAAGVYTKEQVESNPGYYNNGYSAIAIPLTADALEKIGFKCTVNWEAVNRFLPKSAS